MLLSFRRLSGFRSAFSSLLPRYDSSGALQFLDSLTNYEKKQLPDQTQDSEKFPLERMYRLLRKVGDPQSQLRAVHIVGSKGKGSIASLLSSMTAASGVKVGRLLSPHIINLSERISLSTGQSAGSLVQDISSSSLASLILDHKEVVEDMEKEGMKPTYFEYLTAIGLVHFVQNGVPYVVVEAGLGGAGDATNIFKAEQTDFTIVTPIEVEHVGVLGDSLEEIIKSEIEVLKPKRPAIIAKQSSQYITDQILHIAQEKHCEYTEVKDLVSVHHVGYDLSGLALKEVVKVEIDNKLSVDGNLHEMPVFMIGKHQHNNIHTAILSAFKLRHLGWPITIEGVKQGIQQAVLPARFQGCRKDLESEWLILDGAHTIQSAKALATSLREIFPHETLVLILCMMKNKIHEEYINEIMDCRPDAVIFTSSYSLRDSHRTLPPGTLLSIWEKCETQKKLRCRKTITVNISTALVKARKELSGLSKPQSTTAGVICVTGTFYIIEEFLPQRTHVLSCKKRFFKVKTSVPFDSKKTCKLVIQTVLELALGSVGGRIPFEVLKTDEVEHCCILETPKENEMKLRVGLFAPITYHQQEVHFEIVSVSPFLISLNTSREVIHEFHSHPGLL